MPRPYFHNKARHVDEILRVNHAGEYGAIRIYQGQIAASKTIDKPLLEEMLSHEQKHLEYFNQEIAKNQSRPTLLLPLWHVGGYMLGYLSAICGIKTAMLCTEAVEEVIDEHYSSQLPLLQDIGASDLAKKVEEHRLDELHHKNIAIEHGSMEIPMYSYVKGFIMTICKGAIFTSKIL